MHIVELQKKLEEARGESPVRMRLAKLDDARTLLKSGQFTTEAISDYLSLSPMTIEAERERIREYDLAKQRYLRTGRLGFTDEGAYVAVFKK